MSGQTKLGCCLRSGHATIARGTKCLATRVLYTRLPRAHAGGPTHVLPSLPQE